MKEGKAGGTPCQTHPEARAREVAEETRSLVSLWAINSSELAATNTHAHTSASSYIIIISWQKGFFILLHTCDIIT